MKTLFPPVATFLCLPLLLGAKLLEAQQLVVDQAATPQESAPGLYTFVLLSGRVGQEFVPTHRRSHCPANRSLATSPTQRRNPSSCNRPAATCAKCKQPARWRSTPAPLCHCG